MEPWEPLHEPREPREPRELPREPKEHPQEPRGPPNKLRRVPDRAQGACTLARMSLESPHVAQVSSANVPYTLLNLCTPDHPPWAAICYKKSYKNCYWAPHFYRPGPGLLVPVPAAYPNAICAILRICVILGWGYYTEILRQDLHPTTRLASYDKTCIL